MICKFVNFKLLVMKKLIYIFVMAAGMVIASANVHAQDPKGSCCEKKAKTCCSKSTTGTSCDKGDAKKSDAKCCSKAEGKSKETTTPKEAK